MATMVAPYTSYGCDDFFNFDLYGSGCDSLAGYSDNMIVHEDSPYVENGYTPCQPRGHVPPTVINDQSTAHNYSLPLQNQLRIAPVDVDSPFSSPPQNTPPSDTFDDDADMVFQNSLNYRGDSSAGRTPDSNSDSVSQGYRSHINEGNPPIFQQTLSAPLNPTSPGPSSSYSTALPEVITDSSEQWPMLQDSGWGVDNHPVHTHLHPNYPHHSYPNDDFHFDQNHSLSEQPYQAVVDPFSHQILYSQQLQPHRPASTIVNQANHSPHQQRHQLSLPSSYTPDRTSREQSPISSNVDISATSSQDDISNAIVPPVPPTSVNQSNVRKTDSKRKQARREPTTSTLRKGNKKIHPKSSSSARSSASPPQGSSRDNRKGIRHGGLPQDQRLQVSLKRQTGACWTCVVLRMACTTVPHKGRCNRCEQQSNHRDNVYDILGICTSIRLVELDQDFWPRHMADDYSPAALSKYEGLHIFDRPNTARKTIHLTSGYGPVLTCYLSEYESRQGVMTLSQLQACRVQGPHREFVVTRKYSPPLAIAKDDFPDHHKIATAHLNTLLKRQYLQACGETCFGGPDNENYFLARILQLGCDCFLRTPDGHADRLIFKDILHLVLLSWIMDHMFTIEESSLDDVLQSLETPYYSATTLNQVSPRVANRQLKSLFVKLRTDQYGKNLNYLQQKLHQSGKNHWFQNFCHVLYLGVVLGQAQEIIFLNAPARVAANLETQDDARKTADKACENIDKQYAFIMKIFFCKYRYKNPIEGDFGRNTPPVVDGHRVSFLQSLLQLAKQNLHALKSARELPLHPENGPSLSLRLVARFLTTFTDLRVGDPFI